MKIPRLRLRHALLLALLTALALAQGCVYRGPCFDVCWDPCWLVYAWRPCW